MNRSSSLVIRELTLNDETSFFEGMKQWSASDVSWYAADWNPTSTYAQMLTRLEKNSRGQELATGRVPSTIFYGFVDTSIIGRVQIRHYLNDSLLQRGGNIGYAVAPIYRGHGYATKLAKQGLHYCQTALGINRVLLTCADDNVHSWKIIEKLGGALENKFIDASDGRLVRRYWIAP